MYIKEPIVVVTEMSLPIFLGQAIRSNDSNINKYEIESKSLKDDIKLVAMSEPIVVDKDISSPIFVGESGMFSNYNNDTYKIETTNVKEDSKFIQATQPVEIQPRISQPITVEQIEARNKSNVTTLNGYPVFEKSMNLTFSVQAPNLNGVSILIDICIKVKIGYLLINIYYTRDVTAEGQIEIFNSVLPLYTVIEDIIPTYNLI